MKAPSKKSELVQALASCRGAFLSIGLFSGVINILMLTGSIYMLQVYDRVLPSRSVPTLIGLTVLIIFLFGLQGVLDWLRQRLLTRIGLTLDAELSNRIFNIIVSLPLKTRGMSDGLQPLRDFDSVRSFLSGLGPTALFDLPWLPLYLGLCFLLHPWLGLTALGGAIILAGLAILTEVLSRQPLQQAAVHASMRHGQAEASRRNAEAIRAMGMGNALARRWSEVNDKYLVIQERATDVGGGLGSLSKVLRFLLQSIVLGVGAWLAIMDKASPGVIIASSILTSRALAPIEIAIAHWKGFLSARQSWRRLGELLAALPPENEPMPLPAPKKSLAVEGVVVASPGSRDPIVANVSFALSAGDGLGVIGPSASGKSSMVRALVGVWPLMRGAIRLDGATLDHWSPTSLGPSIGYMPQGIELFDGTVAENISRFAEQPDPARVVAAAQAAGAHEMILRLPQGYDTRTGEGAGSLSAGQRQRIALARALYGDPFLVVLDEPNSNLDAEGEAALTEAIKGVRARGGIIVVVAHRPSALAALDQVLVMRGGTVQAFGPRDEVLRKTLVPQSVPQPKPAANMPQPLRAAATGAGPDAS
jgi:PrtD family type I secretion system ABC transporter